MNVGLLLDIFLEFLKVGTFMFGGGYGGLALLHKEVVEVRGWLTDEEFVTVLGIAESTPGPVAINSATYIGYKLHGIVGSVTATLGVTLPAFLVILGIAMGLSRYFEEPLAKVILRGINTAVVSLIFIAFIKVGQAVLIKGNAVSPVELVIFLTAFVSVMLLKQHPITAIGISVALSLIARYVFGI